MRSGLIARNLVGIYLMHCGVLNKRPRCVPMLITVVLGIVILVVWWSSIFERGSASDIQKKPA